MLIGMTYDLRDEYLALGFSDEAAGEFDGVETIDAIAAAIEAAGHTVERIGNVKALTSALASGKRWDLVFNICEGVKGIGREAQVPALLEAYDIPFVFSSSDVMVLTMNKALAKYVVREHDVPTAPFAVVRSADESVNLDIDFPVFVKPLAEGTGKGISSKSLIDTQEDLTAVCKKIIDTFDQPALVETYLPGRDLTVGILGTGKNARVIAVLETTYKEGAEKGSQSFYNKKNYDKALIYKVITDETAKRAAEISLKSWIALGCQDAGRVDLRCDKDDVPNFLEVNPIAGLHPVDSDLIILSRQIGIDYNTLIASILEEAIKRHGLVQKQKKSPLRAIR